MFAFSHNTFCCAVKESLWLEEERVTQLELNQIHTQYTPIIKTKRTDGAAAATAIR